MRQITMGLYLLRWQDTTREKRYLFGPEWPIYIHGAKTPEILSDHPLDSKRIEKLKGYMNEALKYYQPS